MKPANLPAVGSILIPRSCGNCEYFERTKDPAVGICHGVPPTPCVVGGGQDALGRMQFNVEMMVPRVPRARKGCALWALRNAEVN